MSQDTEKRPVFNQPASKQKARSYEEMSRMFKKDEEKLEGTETMAQPPCSAPIPRIACLADSS